LERVLRDFAGGRGPCVRLRARRTRPRRDRRLPIRGRALALLDHDRGRPDRRHGGAVPPVTPAVRSGGGAVVLGLVLATLRAACASPDDTNPPEPTKAPPPGPTATAPSPTTG